MNKIDLIIDALERIDRGHYPPTSVITEVLAAAKELRVILNRTKTSKDLCGNE